MRSAKTPGDRAAVKHRDLISVGTEFDPLLPIQFFPTATGGNFASGEMRLLCALLIDAKQCSWSTAARGCKIAAVVAPVSRRRVGKMLFLSKRGIALTSPLPSARPTPARWIRSYTFSSEVDSAQQAVNRESIAEEPANRSE